MVTLCIARTVTPGFAGFSLFIGNGSSFGMECQFFLLVFNFFMPSYFEIYVYRSMVAGALEFRNSLASLSKHCLLLSLHARPQLWFALCFACVLGAGVLGICLLCFQSTALCGLRPLSSSASLSVHGRSSVGWDFNLAPLQLLLSYLCRWQFTPDVPEVMVMHSWVAFGAACAA